MIRLNITDDVLDKLGFTDYWDEDGTWGGRSLVFKSGSFRIYEQRQMDDEEKGYGKNPKYLSQHWKFYGWFALPVTEGEHDLFFLHEMFDCLKKFYPQFVEDFKEKCRIVHMESYLTLIK